MNETKGGRRPTRRDEQRLRTRAALLTHAHALFTEHGYAAVKVDDIASAAGCSRATFYLHFTSKADVLRTVGVQGHSPRPEAVYEDLDDVLATGSRAEFTAWLERALDWFDAHRTILPAWDEAIALEPDLREIARDAYRALPDAMPSYLSRWPEPLRDEARLRIELLVAQLERFFTRWAVHGTLDIPRDDAAAVLTDIWFPALTPRIDDAWPRSPGAREGSRPDGTRASTPR
ncbi:TetR/AcrR family transcriptional regulator [Rhodococcus sp. NPDC003348]